MTTAEYDHYRGIFDIRHLEAGRAPDGLSLRGAVIRSGPFAAVALLQGKEKTSWHRVVHIDVPGKTYAPFEEAPRLFLELAEVGRAIKDATDQGLVEGVVLEWVRKYGNLGLWGPVGAPDVIGASGGLASSIEPLEYFVDEAARMAFLVELYRDLLNDDGEAVRRRFVCSMAESRVTFHAPGDPLDAVHGPQSLPGLRETLPQSDRAWVMVGLVYLTNVIGTYFSPLRTHGLHSVVPTVTRIQEVEPADLEEDDPWWKFDRGWACNTLLAAIYVQFFDFVCRKKPVITCYYCGKWCAPKKRDAKYCSDSCRNSAFQDRRTGDTV